MANLKPYLYQGSDKSCQQYVDMFPSHISLTLINEKIENLTRKSQESETEDCI